MMGSGGNTPFKAFQEGASEIYRTALRRCSSFRNTGPSWMAAAAERRANRQQTENLNWQQDMFVRLLNLAGLCKEGLVSEDDVSSFRQKIIDHIVVCYDGGEFPRVTRDKLLFIQELLFAKCISDEEYHTAKKSLLYRLAAEGAEIEITDIVFSCRAVPTNAPSTPHAMNRLAELSAAAEKPKDAEEPPRKFKSPVKQLFERLKHGGKAQNESGRARVPHAMDFIRPVDCPARDAPTPSAFDISDQCASPLFHSPTASISSKESSSTSRYKDERSPRKTPATRTLFPPSQTQKSPLSGEKTASSAPEKSPLPAEKPSKSPLKRNPIKSIIRKLHGEEVTKQESGKVANAGDVAGPLKTSTTPKKVVSSSTPKKPWRLDILRPPRLVTGRQESTADSTNEPVVLSPNRAAKAANPETVKPKAKLHSRGRSGDFYIDKVLGENIKKELEHIRSEMNKSTTTQTFTNDQIDSIATRLPADKAELMRFFPKTWCDRYGDIVLDVVHKEFKGHIQDMEKTRKDSMDKRLQVAVNDENSGTNSNYDGATISKATSKGAGTGNKTPKAKMNRCFTTTDERSPRIRGLGTPRKVTSFNSNAEQYEKELDGKLCAEIEKLPHKKTPIRV